MCRWPVRGDGSCRRADTLRSVHRPGQTRREAGTQSQGSSPEDRPAADHRSHIDPDSKESNVKANLARFTGALALLASLALTIGAGVRWY
jgi:hypothetical protein